MQKEVAQYSRPLDCCQFFLKEEELGMGFEGRRALVWVRYFLIQTQFSHPRILEKQNKGYVMNLCVVLAQGLC